MQQKLSPTPDIFQPGEIKDVVVRDLRRFKDQRGWLSELFRHDELAAEFLPVMAYVPSTNPGVTRGPYHRGLASLEDTSPNDLVCPKQPFTEPSKLAATCPVGLWRLDTAVCYGFTHATRAHALE